MLIDLGNINVNFNETVVQRLTKSINFFLLFALLMNGNRFPMRVPLLLMLPYLSRGGQGQRRLTPCTHFPDEHALQGLHHFGLVHPVGITMAQLPCKREHGIHM